MYAHMHTQAHPYIHTYTHIYRPTSVHIHTHVHPHTDTQVCGDTQEMHQITELFGGSPDSYLAILSPYSCAYGLAHTNKGVGG